jgi:hypothetical protein
MATDPAMDSVNAVTAAAMRSAEQTYVFENVEVRKTGRKAENKLRSGKVDELVEVTPIDGTTGSWRKWVREEILFEVK